jgi:hypothetical protein
VNELLTEIIEAHGDMDRWNGYEKIDATSITLQWKRCAMSALDHKRTSELVRIMSALPPKADVADRDRYVCFVPKADIGTAEKGIIQSPWHAFQ